MHPDINFEGNEHRELLGNNLDSSIPWSEDDRWWIHMPARQLLSLRSIGQKIIQAIQKDYTRILLVFVPLGLLADQLYWGDTMKFGFNCLALLALESMFISTAEWIWLFASQTVANILTEMLPNVFPLLIGIASIIQSQFMLLRSFIIGSVIINLLAGTGCSFLIGGIYRSQQGVNLNTTISVSKLTLVILFPFIIPNTLYFTLRNITGSKDRVALISLPCAGVLLSFHVMWLIFKYKSHAHLFRELNEAEESDENENGLTASEHVEIPLRSRAAYLLWLTVVFILAMQCLNNLINAPVPSSTTRIFVGGVLLPFVTNVSNIIKTCLIARSSRMELVLHLTVETAIGLTFFTLPILIIASATVGYPLLISGVPMVLNAILFISVLAVAFLIKDGTLTYLKGCMCLALYSIIVLGLYVVPDEIN